MTKCLLSVMSAYNLFQLYQVLLLLLLHNVMIFTSWCWISKLITCIGEEHWGIKGIFFYCVFWMNDIVVPPTGTFTKCCIVCKSEWWVEWDIYVPHGWNVIWIVHPKLSPSCILLTLMSFQTMIYFLYFVEHKFSSTERKCMETKGWQALKRTTTKNTKYRFFIKLSFYITFKGIQVFVRRRW